jgi:hypothetical protein
VEAWCGKVFSPSTVTVLEQSIEELVGGRLSVKHGDTVDLDKVLRTRPYAVLSHNNVRADDAERS